MGMLHFAARCATYLYGSSTISRFGTLLGSRNRNVSFFFSEMLPTCCYNPKTTLYGTPALPNFKVSQRLCTLSRVINSYCTDWDLLQCMRMEAKNSYFKRVAQIGNFRNIALIVARRHQKLVCAYLNDKRFFGL